MAPSEEILHHIVNYLSEQRIATRPFFWCMHEQPLYIQKGLFSNQSFPVAEKMARNGFYVPAGLGLNQDHLELVTASITEFIHGNGQT